MITSIGLKYLMKIDFLKMNSTDRLLKTRKVRKEDFDSDQQV
jgi:hypothetical protein